MDGAVQLTPLAKYLEDRAAIEKTISLLKYMGGTFLDGNPYKNTIIRLEGVLDGMSMCERAVDM